MHGFELFQEGAMTRSTGPMSTPWTYNTTASLFPESSCRDEHHAPPPPQSYDNQPVASTSHTTLSHTTIVVLPEVTYGILADGRMTGYHPSVVAYLNALIGSYMAPADQRWATFAHQEVHGDPTLGKPEDVGILIRRPSMDKRCCEAVFTLAALKVLDNVGHRAHQMLWSPAVRARTVETIERALRCPVYPLYCPPELWQGERSLAGLEARHKKAMEALRPAEPKTRKRAAPRATRATTRAANGEQAAPAPTPTPTTVDKGKATDRGTSVRATRARATKAKETPAPTRRSTRRAATTTKKSPLRQSTTAAEVITLEAKAERMATPALATPAPEPDLNETEAEVDVQAVEPPAKRARTSKRAPSRANKRVATRTTAPTSATAPAPTPAPTPAPAPIPSPPLEGSATPEIPSPEDALQPSRSSTAVGSEAGMDASAGKADEEPEPEPEAQPEDDGRRKSTRTTTRKRTAKAEALDAEKKTVTAKRPRTRRR